ncbi:MAG TPA: dethiobiotin synthase [Crinalium sp.]|jgi:dethiobiotin synthetase
MLNALLIAGTDSGVGKTVLTTALAAYWQTYCTSHSLGIMKPVQTGGGDRDLYHRLFALDQSPEEITPLAFDASLPPPLAAEREGRKVKLEKVWQAFEALCHRRDWVLVEALSGLGSPITRETTVADLAWDWRIPTVLVVPIRRGAIAQAVANVALAHQAKAHLKGIVLNCVEPCTDQDMADWAPVDLLQSLTQKPVLGCIPHLSDPTDLAKLAQVASHLDLERLVSLPF